MLAPTIQFIASLLTSIAIVLLGCLFIFIGWAYYSTLSERKQIVFEITALLVLIAIWLTSWSII